GTGVDAGVELAPLFVSLSEISSAEDRAGSLLRAQNREKVVVLHADELDRIERGQPVGLLATDDFQIVIALYDAVAGHSELAVLFVGVQRADTGPHDDAIGLGRSDGDREMKEIFLRESKRLRRCDAVARCVPVLQHARSVSGLIVDRIQRAIEAGSERSVA